MYRSYRKKTFARKVLSSTSIINDALVGFIGLDVTSNNHTISVLVADINNEPSFRMSIRIIVVLTKSTHVIVDRALFILGNCSSSKDSSDRYWTGFIVPVVVINY